MFEPPEMFNIADYFLRDRLEEGGGGRVALRTAAGTLTFAEVERLAGQYAHRLRAAGVRQEERVLLALPDGPAFVGALFGILKLGAVVVMVNPQMPAEQIAGILRYTRAPAAVIDVTALPAFTAAMEASGVRTALVDPDVRGEPDECAPAATHRDDPAIWLFTGGTTGRPKAVVQTHRSFANTTECYAKQALGYREDDVTVSVPKLYFGYATGSNLFFPFSVGASAALYSAHPTADIVFDQIRRHRPTILVNVPKMVREMVEHPDAAAQDLSCLRFATSAGEALPAALYQRWREVYGVELLDGLGTAEMWHIFVSNVPGQVRPGTLGKAVAGFVVEVRDDDGRTVADGEIGRLWVRGGSRAIWYWQDLPKTVEAFRGEWFVAGDMVCRDEDGYFTYAGRADDALKVGGKWLLPGEVEACLSSHPSVADAVVVGVPDDAGLTKPVAFVVSAGRDLVPEELQRYCLERLEPYKHPRHVFVVDVLPRTHLGKVDRGGLKRDALRRVGDDHVGRKNP